MRMPKTRKIKPTDGRLKKNRAKRTASKAAATKTMMRTKATTRKRNR